MSVEFWRNSLGIPVTIPVECVNNSSWLCLTISAKHKIQNSKFGAQYIPKSSKIWLISFSITEIRKTGHQPQVFTILNLWSRDMEPPLKLLEMDKVPLLHLFQSGTLNQLWSHINPSINPAKSYPTLFSKILKKIEKYLKSLFYN